MIQYGPWFNGPPGIAIPSGRPLLIVIGYLLWRDGADTGTADEGDDDFSDEDDAPPGADTSADDA